MVSEDIDRLTGLARRDQWSIEELDWAGLEAGGLPVELRQAIADVCAQLLHGEKTAHGAAARLVTTFSSPAARAFCALQERDEARHVAFFERVISLTGCAGRVRPSTERLMAEVDRAREPEEIVLGMHILVEAIAHSSFIEAGRLVADVEPTGPMGFLKPIAGDWLPRLLARDESRHIAFGVQYLRACVPELEPSARHRLEAHLERWGAWLLESVRDPDLLVGVGFDAAALGSQLLEDLNLRIGQVGLSTRIRL